MGRAVGGEGGEFGGGVGKGGAGEGDTPMNANGMEYAGIAPRWGAKIMGPPYPGRWPELRDYGPLGLSINGVQVANSKGSPCGGRPMPYSLSGRTGVSREIDETLLHVGVGELDVNAVADF